MSIFRKWFSRYDESGFINKKHEKLEKIFLWSTIAFIFTIFAALILWVIKELSTPAI